MKRPLLTFTAQTPFDLLRHLAVTDISVPRKTAGRTAQHRERYTMARFLATAYVQGWLDFPLSVEHRDHTGNPDFLLSSPSFTVGVECVEAVAQSWYEIDVLREIAYPDALVFMQKFEPGRQTFTHEQRHAIASGKYAGPPWMGDEPERDWAAALEHFIDGKFESSGKGTTRP